MINEIRVVRPTSHCCRKSIGPLCIICALYLYFSRQPTILVCRVLFTRLHLTYLSIVYDWPIANSWEKGRSLFKFLSIWCSRSKTSTFFLRFYISAFMVTRLNKVKLLRSFKNNITLISLFISRDSVYFKKFEYKLC